jgi:DNA-binding Lrp family transcriptional regulator
LIKIETFSPKLDKISENIIYLLSIDSRQSISNLAKKLHMSRKIVENRYNRLFDIGYIKPLTISNEKSRICFTIYVKLSKIDNKILDKIKNISGLIKLKETLGAYDLSILIDVNSQKKADKIISRISNLLHNNIIKFDVIRHELEDTLGYKSFCKNSKFLLEYEQLVVSPISLTKDQETVLNFIRKKCDFNYSELQKETGMGYKKLKQIINFLVSNKVIRFSVDPDYDKLELEFHNVLLKIRVGKKKEFENYLRSHPRIHWIKRSTGIWDYILSVTARNINEFIDIVREIRSDNKNIVLEETTLISKVNEMRRH